MQAAAIEATTDAISFVALHAQAEGQVAGGHGIAEGIGAFGPVGEAANLVTNAGVHEEIITFEFCGDRKRDSSLRPACRRLAMTAVAISAVNSR